MALEASEFAPEDCISNMPDNVVTNILHRLPFQDAVRTGILSRNWRFKWTMLSQLKFDADFFVYLSKRKGKNSIGEIIRRLLLHFNGSITKSVLILPLLDVEDIDHLVLFLSRKGIMDLTFTDWSKPHVKLPTHLFSCLELKHLDIYGFCFDPPPSFRGFPNLLSLELGGIQFGDNDLGEFLTRSPLLEILKMGYLSYTGKVKLAEIAKLKNLKILTLSLCHLETTTVMSSSDVLELVGHLPKLQELGLDFQDCMLTDGGAKKKFTAFPSLKALDLTRIDLGNGINVSCALEMIRHFPNLQTLEFTAVPHVVDPIPISIPVKILEAEYKMMKLQSVKFSHLKGSKNEVNLIKYLLACSPSLKKIGIISVIEREWYLTPDEQLVFAKKLLKLPRASPVAEIDFN